MEYKISDTLSPLPKIAGHMQYDQGWSNISSPKGNVCFFILDGCFSFKLDGRTVTAKKNDLVFFKKHTEYVVTAESDVDYLYLHFKADMKEAGEGDMGDGNLIIPERISYIDHPEKRERTVRLISMCNKMIRERPIYKDARLKNVFGELLITAAILHAEEKKDSVPPSIKRIEKYVRENVLLPLTLSSLSDKFFLSKQYIMRSFKKHYGTNVTGYINDVKLEYSLGLLSESDMTVDEISNMLSYSQSSYFCRLFKRRFGITPTEYRKDVFDLY